MKIILTLVLLSLALASTFAASENKSTQIHSSNEEGREEEPPVRVTRKFEKGYNSTSVMEGSDVDLYCQLSRGGNDTRYKVVWRIADVYIDPKSPDLNLTQYSYTERIDFTQIRIHSVTLDHRGWYQCALWDTLENESFDPKYIPKYNARFEIRLRVKEKMAWIYPVAVTLVEAAALIIFLVVILRWNLLNPDGLGEDDEDDDGDSKSGKHHAD